MSAYTEIETAASGNVSCYTDAATPNGYFAVTAKVLGIVTTYLLKGNCYDIDSASIVGRVELTDNTRGTIYKGHKLKGGHFEGPLNGYKEAFTRIAH